MAELSFPTAGGGSVTDASYENLIGAFAPSGLVGQAGESTPLVYADSTGRQVKVRPNRAAIVRGFRWETDGAGVVRAIDANTSGQPRTDLAVLRLNRADWTVTFQVVKGTPSSAAPPPAITMQNGPTGVFEIPLARISVPNGAATLPSNSITDIGVYISHQMYSGNMGHPPLAPLNPMLFYEANTARLTANLGGTYQIVGERENLTKIAAQASWGASANSNIWLRRHNGFAYMQAVVTRTGSDLAVNTDSPLFVLPARFRPDGDIAGVAFAGSNCMRVYVTGSTGVVSLVQYGITFKTGAALTIHPMWWPANTSV